MSTRHSPSLERTLGKTHVWLKELMEELGWEDERRAYLALKVTLHALRDRMTVDEAAQFAAQLPTLIRGLFYEGWNPSDQPSRERHLVQFLGHIWGGFRNDPQVDAGEVARAVFRVISRHVTEGEVAQVKQQLPLYVRELWA